MRIDISEYSDEIFFQSIQQDGYCLIENMFDSETIQRLKISTQEAMLKEIDFLKTTNYSHYGTLQACPMYGGEFLKIIENRSLMDPFEVILHQGAIIWTYIATSMPPQSGNFSSKIHIDRPWYFEDHCECIAALIMLDDFTEDNGATWVLPGSQKQRNAPTEEYFFQNSIQMTAPAGSVLYTNARVWHAGGINKTNQWRNALAIGMIRPYLKQKFDFPKMLEHYQIDVSNLSEYAKQKLGFHAIAPKNLNEFYGIGAERTYTQTSEWEIASQYYNKLDNKTSNDV